MLRILLGALELGLISAFVTVAVALVRQSWELRELLRALRESAAADEGVSPAGRCSAYRDRAGEGEGARARDVDPRLSSHPDA